jgi:hypothetical protein
MAREFHADIARLGKNCPQLDNACRSKLLKTNNQQFGTTGATRKAVNRLAQGNGCSASKPTQKISNLLLLQ